jgi:hypothetical protein
VATVASTREQNRDTTRWIRLPSGEEAARGEKPARRLLKRATTEITRSWDLELVGIGGRDERDDEREEQADLSRLNRAEGRLHVRSLPTCRHTGSRRCRQACMEEKRKRRRGR